MSTVQLKSLLALIACGPLLLVGCQTPGRNAPSWVTGAAPAPMFESTPVSTGGFLGSIRENGTLAIGPTADAGPTYSIRSLTSNRNEPDWVQPAKAPSSSLLARFAKPSKVELARAKNAAVIERQKLIARAEDPSRRLLASTPTHSAAPTRSATPTRAELYRAESERDKSRAERLANDVPKIGTEMLSHSRANANQIRYPESKELARTQSALQASVVPSTRTPRATSIMVSPTTPSVATTQRPKRTKEVDKRDERVRRAARREMAAQQLVESQKSSRLTRYAESATDTYVEQTQRVPRVSAAEFEQHSRR